MNTPRKTNTLAIVSLVFGILGWTALPLIGSIVAVITGHMARNAIRLSNGLEDGEGLAITGLVLGWIAVGITLLIIALVILIVMFGAAA
ncbi:MAG: DUF4190 domain-containing protein [Pseudomonadota bacterium]